MKNKSQLTIVLVVRLQEKLEGKMARKRFFLFKVCCLVVLNRLFEFLLMILVYYQERL